VIEAIAEMLGGAVISPDGIVFELLPECAADGERRIGYASIMRLVERVRELHWSRDVLPLATAGPIDSITRSLEADFRAPFEINDRVLGRYRVGWCQRRSYGLQVSFSSQRSGTDLARVDLVSVFYDPVRRRSATPPDAVLEALRASSRLTGAVPKRRA